MMLTIIAFIAVLGVLVLAHELGHFITARKFGVKVEEFGFGYPPKAASYKGKKTEWSLNWLPIGGFCKLKGEDGEGNEDKDSFGAKKAWQRAIMLSGGVAMNIVLAAVLLSMGFFIGLPQVLDGPADAKDAKDIKIQVISVVNDSPAQAAGIEVGDIITALDGQVFSEVAEIQEYIKSKDGATAVSVKRGAETVEKEIAPEELEVGEGEKREKKRLIGVGLVKTGIVSHPWYRAIWYGTKSTASMTGRIVAAFYGLFRDMIVKREVAPEISGPVGIAVMTGRVVHLGFVYVLQFAAILSINLAILNLLPVPALDGGRLLFLLIEKIRRKPIDQKTEAAIHNVGFIVLMVLVVLVTFRDIGKFGAKALGSIRQALPF